jgi:hypothetical protein
MEPRVMALVVFLIAVVALAFIAAEVAARAWIRLRGTYFVFSPGQRLRQWIDRETLPELEPLARFDVNDAGERGPELPTLRPDESLYRVLVAGGSAAECYMLDQDAAWAGALGRLLATPDSLRALAASKTHVGSIAKSGVGAEALDVIFARVLPRYPRLSAIVILVGASDVLRWLEEGASPSSPSAAVPVSELFRCHPEGPFGWKPQTLAIAELARRAHRRVLRPTREHPDAGRWLRKARSMRTRAKVIRATMPDPDVMLAHFETHFRNVIAMAGRHSDRVVVVRQSWFGKDALTADELAHMWHGGVGQAWREEVTTFYSIEITARLMALMDARAASIADELGIEHIDLNAVLEPSLAAYYDFFHLTPAGARTVAGAVAELLLRRSRAVADEASTCVDLRAS